MVHYFNVKFLSFGFSIIVIMKSRKLKLCRGHLFSNAVKVMLFISDAQYYVPIV